MVMTRRLLVVLAAIALSVPVQAQWLTKADESRSGRISRYEHPLVKGKQKGEADDAGIADAFKWYWRQRTFGLGYIPEGALQKATAQREAMRSSGKGMSIQAAQPAWSLVGPDNIGGRINDIAINPYNPNTIFIGAANGGVWKTLDAGASWIPLTEQLQSVSMGSLAIDPNDTNIVYAGTGELPGTVDSYAGYGLLRSVDGGKSWSDVGPSTVAAYSRVIVNPKHSNLVYAAAGRSGGGVLRSSDGGNSWNWLAGGLPQNQSVSDLALSMNGDVAVLYAGVVGNGVYQSTDGGDNWKELQPFPTGTAMVRIALDADPTNWQNVVVLDVGNVAGSDDFAALEVSTDGGKNWTDGGNEFETQSALFGEPGGSAPPQGWYDVYIRVDPQNFNHMLAGGISIWQTNDAGQSWENVALSYQGGIHPDQHAAAFAASDPNIVFVGNDGGLFSSNDGGSNFTQETYPLPITQFYGIGIDQTKDNVTYGGTQDNGTLSGASGGLEWDGILGGDGTLTQVDPKTPSKVYCENPQSFPTAYPTQLADNGLDASIDSTVWLDPFAADASNDIIYWGCQRLTYSKNQGTTWTNCSKVFGSAASGTTISAIDAFGDGKTVLVGTGGGNIYLTTNNGTSFTDVSSGVPGRAVTWVKFNPSLKTTFYATFSGFGPGHVFKTTNNGGTWANISSTLPDIPVNSIVMDPENPTVLYVGTDVGVFFSPNDGGEWMPYGTGLPNTGIDFMAIQTKNRVLRVGTHGRSIWQVPLENDVTGIVLPAQRSVWTLGDTASIQWHGFASPVMLELSLDGGASWQTVASGAPDSTFPISNVTYPATENALVRVSDGTNMLLSPLFSISQQKAGNEIGTVADTRFYTYDIAYDKDDNVLWATNFSPSENYIFKLDPDNGTVLDSVRIALNSVVNRNGLTGIKYDPKTKNLFIQQVNGTADGNWNSYIYEVTTKGVIVKTVPSPAAYGTGIYVRGDTLLVVDRMTEKIQRATLDNWDFSSLNPLDFSDTRNATYGPRGLTYYPKLDQYLLAYTDFQGTTLNGSYMLFLDPETGEEQNAFSVVVGENTNVRGMEYDSRGAGNTAWMTVLNSGTTSQIVKLALSDGPASAPSASLTLVPSPVAFGNLDSGKTTTIQAELRNSGAVATTISSITIAPAGTPFALGSISLPHTLQAGDSLEVDVTFTPRAQGPFSASLDVTYGQDNQQVTFPITGFATINGSGVTPLITGNAWGLELTPNPARDFVNITLDVSLTDAAQIRVFDVTGREVRTIALGVITAGEHEREISTAGLPNGIYFVRVIGSNGEVAAGRLAIAR